MREYRFQGGVLLVGGNQILLFELSSRESQEKVKGKRKRLEAKKKSTDAVEVSRAKAKELERESRKKKPNAVVEWPWSNITTYVALNPSEKVCRFITLGGVLLMMYRPGSFLAILLEDWLCSRLEI